jgi:hypothetical protein
LAYEIHIHILCLNCEHLFFLEIFSSFPPQIILRDMYSLAFGFRCNGSTTDQIFCIHQIPDKKWEHNETVHQLLETSRKPMIQLGGEVLHGILIEFGVPMKLVRLIKMCLNETYSKAHTII